MKTYLQQIEEMVDMDLSNRSLINAITVMEETISKDADLSLDDKEFLITYLADLLP